MERHKIEKRLKKKAPRVPIKTYKWEDVKRSRLKGGYPWTYLYKGPFQEEVDLKFKMDAKSKASKKNTLEIKDVTNGIEEKTEVLLPEQSGYIVITEVPSDSDIHSKDVPSGSVAIEEVGDAETINLESAESSDNISQYLDKEEPPVEPEVRQEIKPENGRQERAKSEDTSRKRKLSIDSSYSRKSLSKLAIMKKLKEAKEKIKVPKLHLPSLALSNPLKPDTPKTKEETKKPKKQTEPKPLTTPFKPDPKGKPVYIHIPLKPPEGETDEFSYLEFGEKKPEEPKKVEEEKEKEKEKEEPKPKPPEAPTIEISEPYDLDGRRFSGDPDDIVAFEILKSETIDLDHAAKNGLQGGSNYLIIEQEDDEKSESRSMIIIMSDDEPGASTSASAGPSRTGSIKKEPSRQGSRKGRAKSAEPERKRKLSADSSYSRRSLSKLGLIKKLKDATEKIKSTLTRSDSKKAPAKITKEEPAVATESKPEVKPTKSKSNEPKYIHIPLKPPEGQSDEFSYLEFEEKKEANVEKVEAVPTEDKASIESPESPKAEGVQFIFLTPPSDDEVLSQPDIPETPSSETKVFFPSKVHELKQIAKDAIDATSPNKQLQPVKEEESPNVSPTKVLESKEEKVEEVKNEEPKSEVVKSEEAKSEEPGKKKSEEVKSEEPEKKKGKKGKKKKAGETKEVKNEEKLEKSEEPQKELDKAKTKEDKTEKKDEKKVVVDEEDGLTESAATTEEQTAKPKEVEDLRSSLKTEGSPVFKKKVSFKRRSRDDSKDGDYEEIQAPADDKSTEKKSDVDEHQSKLAVLGTSQSMSVDEEKSYLDEQKIIKTTSLEEDYNRWSKLSDHEYEPVNPPPDNVVLPVTPEKTATSTVHVIDTDREFSTSTTQDRKIPTSEVSTVTVPDNQFKVHEMQTETKEKFVDKPKTVIQTVTTVTTSKVSGPPPKPEGPGKFQKAFKTQTDKFKTKLHEMKKPNIKLPSKPHIKKPNFKFEKPKINLPKLPDTSKITLPTFSLPRKSPVKRSLKQRQYSTESNAGGSKKNYFDFRTYPRLFKKKPKDELDSFSSKSEREVPEFATVPRTRRKDDDRWGGRDSIRIPLHAEDSVDQAEDREREDSVERRIASHMRYDQDIDIDDAYERENQEIHAASPFSAFNSRWNHGSFHPQPSQDFEDSRNQQVTDLDSPDDGPAPHESFDTNTSKDIHSSESSLGIHRRGVLEEIDSDEFFLRQKGISQDNIEVGMYLSSEIREAFKSPTNALADLERQPNYSYERRDSNQSLPETPKRKSARKPKRKKTPHVSQEQISFDQDSELDLEVPPSRPKRRSKRNKKQKDPESIVPYQETIHVDVPDVTVGIIQSEDREISMYENEQMQGKEQPEIKLTDPYDEFTAKYDSEEEAFREEDKPSPPPRKHRSLKSLNYSEHDSILGDVDPDRDLPLEEVEVYKSEHEYIIPTPEVPPVKPKRTLSRSSSKSIHEEVIIEAEEPPIRPTRSRSRTRSYGGDSLTMEEPCVEEICVQDFRDHMGYAVIDKNVKREPPLPPPKTTPRRKKVVQSTEQKFFTVPRPLNDEPPIRPIRNYSTLGPSRPPRKKSSIINMTDEEKENIDITQYIEIDEEPNPELVTGEVIQKMRDRPLPAPPRPPRKTKGFQDVSSQENLDELEDYEDDRSQVLEEAEVSTQTEPLPDDFICEDVEQRNEVKLETEIPTQEEEKHVIVEKRLITPTHYSFEETITHGSLVVQPLNGAKILPDSELTKEKPLEHNIPVTKDYDDETSEIPEEFTKLKDPEPKQSAPPPVPSVTSGPSVIERIIERPVLVQPDSTSEVEVLKAQKLQVSDLDVDRLSVNELLASRIVVSEIESGNIQANEIASKSGALKVGEIELPPGIVQQLFERLQSVAQEQASAQEAKPEEKREDPGQKKTPIEEVAVETLPPQRPPRKTEEDAPVQEIDASIGPQIDLEDTETDSLRNAEIEETQQQPPEPPVRAESIKRTEIEITLEEPLLERTEEPLLERIEEPPQRPPRQSEKPRGEEQERISDEMEDLRIEARMSEPEIDDEPPPRPPEPQIEYFPSQPPASFYALKAQKYVETYEDDIPTAPRRRRHHKPPISRSSSEDSPAPPPSRRRFRSPEPTIPQLTGQLIHACGSAANSSVKRLIAYISKRVLGNEDGQQDMNVMIVMLLLLVAGLILLRYGEGKTVHYHHWEYFNPPRDM